MQPGLPSQLLLRRPRHRRGEESSLPPISASLGARRHVSEHLADRPVWRREPSAEEPVPAEAIARQYAAQLVQPLIDGRNLQASLTCRRASTRNCCTSITSRYSPPFPTSENALIAVQQNTGARKAAERSGGRSRRALRRPRSSGWEGTIDIITPVDDADQSVQQSRTGGDHPHRTIPGAGFALPGAGRRGRADEGNCAYRRIELVQRSEGIIP